MTGSASEGPTWEARPLGLGDLDAAARLADALRAAGYEEKAVAGALGVDVSWSLSEHTLAVYRRRLAERFPLHTLIQLFTLGTPVDTEAAVEALVPADIDALTGLGLLDQGGRGLRAKVGIAENRGVFLVHDNPGAAGESCLPTMSSA